MGLVRGWETGSTLPLSVPDLESQVDGRAEKEHRGQQHTDIGIAAPVRRATTGTPGR